MKKYKTWEAIKLIGENKENKFTDSSKRTLTLDGRGNITIISSLGEDLKNRCFNPDREWELVQQPVSFLEAVKAYAEGKTISCNIGKRTYVYRPNEKAKVFNSMGGYLLVDVYNENEAISTEEILKGEWFIGGSND
jgi:hypothetical protein